MPDQQDERKKRKKKEEQGGRKKSTIVYTDISESVEPDENILHDVAVFGLGEATRAISTESALIGDDESDLHEEGRFILAQIQ